MKINENPIINENLIPKYEGKLDVNKPTTKMIYELIRYIKDPEHPHTLEQLKVVTLEDIKVFTVNTKYGSNIDCIEVSFTPTVPHCSMASIIGLSIIKILKHFFIKQYLVVKLVKDTHVDFKGINKQLSDKDRVYAAFENQAIADLIDECVTLES